MARNVGDGRETGATVGYEAQLWQMAGALHNHRPPYIKADFILANPPFNISDWGGERLRDEKRWQCGVPPLVPAEAPAEGEVSCSYVPDGRRENIRARL